MINLDDRLLSKLAPNELFLLLQIVKRMRVNKMVSWPSIELLAKECNWDERTVKTWRAMLIKKGYIHMELRPGKPTLYRLRKTGIGVYHGVDSDTGVEEEAEGGTKIEGVQNLSKKRVQKMRGKGVQNLPPELVNQELLNNGRGLNAKKTPPPADFDSFMEEVDRRAVEAKKEKGSPKVAAKGSYERPPRISSEAINGVFNDMVEQRLRATEEVPDIESEEGPTHILATTDITTLPGKLILVNEGVNLEETTRESVSSLQDRLKISPKADNAMEAQMLIEKWCAGNQEQIKWAYDVAKRKLSPDELTERVIDFCGHFSTTYETGKQLLFFSDPARYFQNGLTKWLQRQNQFDREQAAKAAQTRAGQKKSGAPNSFGGDPAKYQEKQRF